MVGYAFGIMANWGGFLTHLLDKTPQLCDSTVGACFILQFCLQEEWVSV